MAVTNFVSNRLASKKLVSNRTFAYEGVVDYVGGRMSGLYIDNLTHAYNNVTCLSSNQPSCPCCLEDEYGNCNSCGTWYYLSIPNSNTNAIPSSSFKSNPSGGYYNPATKKGFRTLGFCGVSRAYQTSNAYVTCTNCSGDATETYLKTNGGSGFFGYNAVAAIKAEDSSLWTWGSGDYGQLGNGTFVSYTFSPVQVGTHSWKIVRGSAYHFAAIRSDDTLWTWGANDNGQIGNNTTESRNSPVQVSGSWKFVTVGAYSTFGIKSDDTLWAWGNNSGGILGDNTTTFRSSPVQISGGGEWKFVMSDGLLVSCGIKKDGRAYAWGNNSFSQIGDGTFINRSSPVLVAGGFSDWENISIQGWTWKYGIRSNGTIWCWGHVPFGVSSAITYRSSPVQIGSRTDHLKGSSQASYGAVYLSTQRIAAFITKNGNLVSYNGYDATRTTLYGSGSAVEYIHGFNEINGGDYTGNYLIKNPQY